MGPHAGVAMSPPHADLRTLQSPQKQLLPTRPQAEQPRTPSQEAPALGGAHRLTHTPSLERPTSLRGQRTQVRHWAPAGADPPHPSVGTREPMTKGNQPSAPLTSQSRPRQAGGEGHARLGPSRPQSYLVSPKLKPKAQTQGGWGRRLPGAPDRKGARRTPRWGPEPAGRRGLSSHPARRASPLPSQV